MVRNVRGEIMILLVYNKNNGEVLHYVESNAIAKPTLFGLYNASIKNNYPDLQLEDMCELYVDESLKEDIFRHSKMSVVDNELIFEEVAELSPKELTQEEKNTKKLEELEKIIAEQQKLIESLTIK